MHTTRRKTITGLTALLLTLLLAAAMTSAVACSTDQPAEQTTDDAQTQQEATPEEAPGAEEGAEEGSAQPMDGEALVQKRCTVCHNLDRVDSAKKDMAGWESTIDRMIANGATVNDEEKKVIAEYLTKR